MDYLVSIIIPIYNVGSYLDKCIMSVINQTYSNLEIILVDDGSTDSSGTICDKWGRKDNRVVVIHKENGGLSDARNKGISIAKGLFYSFVDGDDWIEKDMIQSTMHLMIKNNCQIGVCNIIQIDSENHTYPFYRPVDVETILEDDSKFITLKQPSVCNKIFSRELFIGTEFPVGKYYEDTYVFHKLAFKANRIVLTGRNSYWYVIREGSIIGQSKKDNRYFDFVEAVWERMRFFQEHNIQSCTDEAALELYAAYNNCLHELRKTEQNRELFRIARNKYHDAYSYLMKSTRKIGIKQYIRLVLLDYCPTIHKWIY